jgi:hypothetical protein
MVNAEDVVAGFEFNDLWLPSAISLINFRFRGCMEIKTLWLQSGHLNLAALIDCTYSQSGSGISLL